jgi:hypothetical protein
MRFNSNDTLDIYVYYDGSSYTGQLSTTQVFRDPSAWYHFVLAVDTTQATASNRIKFYVNGVQVTAFGTANYPNQNQALVWNASGNTGYFINAQQGNQYFFDGYLAELNYIDGQALTPNSYGTNGFYLKFTDTTSTTTLGYDFSPNGNNWTTNNISLTAGSTYDSMTDVPTLTSATTANYCVLNPLDTGGTAPSRANLELTAGAAERGVRSTMAIPTTGTFYMEALVGTNQSGATDIAFGFVARTTNLAANPSGISNGWLCYATATTNITRNGTSTLAGTGTALVDGDVLQLAIDLANNKGWLGKNNTWFNGSTGTDGNPSTGANSTFTFSSPPELFVLAHCYSSTINTNFGQRPFAYTPPTGFVRLNTFNLPTPTIGATAATTANKYMNIALYTGTGSSQSITGLGFQPDWTWIKERNASADHGLYDAVRGVQIQLESNNTGAETTETTGLTAFGSDGFTVGALAQLNTSADTYVAWNWKANGAGVSNTAGSITSTVSANTSAGFSIVTYTGTGSANDTVGHGLGVTPAMVITKRRSSGSGAFNWMVKHSSLASNHNLILESTGASTDVTSGFGSGGIANLSSSTTFGFLNGTSSNPNNANTSGETYVAYCFAPIAGYSAFGTYIGNASTDGPFVYTGFRPRWVMVKNTTSTQSWQLMDTSRSTYNAATANLLPNSSSGELTGTDFIDMLSNGFKIRQSSAGNWNNSGDTYIYMAFAEAPFKYARSR